MSLREPKKIVCPPVLKWGTQNGFIAKCSNNAGQTVTKQPILANIINGDTRAAEKYEYGDGEF